MDRRYYQSYAILRFVLWGNDVFINNDIAALAYPGTLTKLLISNTGHLMDAVLLAYSGKMGFSHSSG